MELVFHHIICDGFSQAVIMRELGILYDAYRSGGTAALDEPRVQYENFARRQRAALEAQGLAEVVAPWLERLEGAPEAARFADRPSAPRNSQ